MEFEYYKTRTMEPREGVKFATTYYKLRLSELKRLQQFIVQVARDIALIQNPELQDFVTGPLKRFKRTTTQGEYYCVVDIVQDMLEQIQSGKDVPSGMLGRWNRLFEDTEYDIQLQDETETVSSFEKLFK